MKEIIERLALVIHWFGFIAGLISIPVVFEGTMHEGVWVAATNALHLIFLFSISGWVIRFILTGDKFFFPWKGQLMAGGLVLVIRWVGLFCQCYWVGLIILAFTVGGLPISTLPSELWEVFTSLFDYWGEFAGEDFWFALSLWTAIFFSPAQWLVTGRIKFFPWSKITSSEDEEQLMLNRLRLLIHWGQQKAPEETNQAILDFLTSVQFNRRL